MRQKEEKLRFYSKMKPTEISEVTNSDNVVEFKKAV